MTDKPFEYIGSNAETYTSYASRTQYYTDWPSYQPIVVVASLAAFLIYFCILREENDIDELMYRDLCETVPPNIAKQLRAAYTAPEAGKK